MAMDGIFHWADRQSAPLSFYADLIVGATAPQRYTNQLE
jgi:hypothetical protein